LWWDKYDDTSLCLLSWSLWLCSLSSHTPIQFL
jgi:hypothetical protein